jgi:hypothetical protein
MNTLARIKQIQRVLASAELNRAGVAFNGFAGCLESLAEQYGGRLPQEKVLKWLEESAVKAAINTRADAYVFFAHLPNGKVEEIVQLWLEGKEDEAYQLAISFDTNPNQEASPV